MASALNQDASSAKVRRTQDERSAATRERLLDATIDCLIEVGYSATTTTLTAERAGVSRGAQLHHYPTKTELVAAAVEHLGRRIGQDLARQADKLPAGGDRLSSAIDLLWAGFATPLFTAWLELVVAARTDPELRAQVNQIGPRVERSLRGHLRQVFGEDVELAAGHDVAVELTLEVMFGMALTGSLSVASRRTVQRREAQHLAAWKAALPGLIEGG